MYVYVCVHERERVWLRIRFWEWYLTTYRTKASVDVWVVVDVVWRRWQRQCRWCEVAFVQTKYKTNNERNEVKKREKENLNEWKRKRRVKIMKARRIKNQKDEQAQTWFLSFYQLFLSTLLLLLSSAVWAKCSEPNQAPSPTQRPPIHRWRMLYNIQCTWYS